MFPEKINNITYEYFQRIIVTIEKHLSFCNDVYAASNHSIDFFECESMFDVLCELFNVTQIALNDELNTLEYFVYELDFGKSYDKCDYDTGDDIIETPFRSARDLWLYYALDNKFIDKNEYQSLLENSQSEQL